MDDYLRKTLDDALELADAGHDELTARLPAAVRGDNPDSAAVYAYASGEMAAVIRELARVITDMDKAAAKETAGA